MRRASVWGEDLRVFCGRRRVRSRHLHLSVNSGARHGPFPQDEAVRCEALHFAQALVLDALGNENALLWGETRLEAVSQRVAANWPDIDAKVFRADVESRARAFVAEHPLEDKFTDTLVAELKPCGEFRGRFPSVF